MRILSSYLIFNGNCFIFQSEKIEYSGSGHDDKGIGIEKMKMGNGNSLVNIRPFDVSKFQFWG